MHSNNQKKKISLVCPVMNEEEVIALFLNRIQPVIDQSLILMGDGATAEIVFVDDGSTDATARLIATEAQKNSNIKLVRFSRNFGKEAALSAGLRHADGDAVIPIDVDLQDPPAIIVDMVRHWLDGAEVVNAKRVNRNTDTWIKRATAGMFYEVYNKMATRPIPSNVGDFRLLDRCVVSAINDFTEKNRFMKSLFSWVGFKESTVEYIREERIAGTSKFKYWKLWNFALDGITASTTAPLRIWTYIGIILACFTALFAVYLTIRTMIVGVDVPGYASLMVVVLITSSINFISLGFLGEYIGRIAEEVRNRPLYIISETINLKEPTQG